MADYTLDIVDFLDKSRYLPLIDVRSPAEYEQGHIPGAMNLPLFNNEERSVVGTLYLQHGSSEAIMKGLELTGPKMKEYATRAKQLAPGGETLLHCWRGGMRSNSMAWLLNTVGIKTRTLEGGYKRFRRFIHSSFEHPLKLIIIGGMTGSGKTVVLENLEAKGNQVINLEGLANHKGSVFGGIGMPPQPTTEQFENDLFARLRQLNTEKNIFVEDESLAIGRVYIPRPFYGQLSNGVFITLNVPLNRRINLLLEAYTGGNSAYLVEGVKRIAKHLGLENAARVIEFIQRGEMASAIELVLAYYDKLYTRGMALHHRKETIEITVKEDSPDEIAERIMKLTKDL